MASDEARCINSLCRGSICNLALDKVSPRNQKTQEMARKIAQKSFFHKSDFFLDSADFGIIVASMTETPTLSFAEDLRMKRKKLGMTQQQLGEALGYSRSAIIKFEKGINTPPRRSIDGITMMLNIYLLANS